MPAESTSHFVIIVAPLWQDASAMAAFLETEGIETRTFASLAECAANISPETSTLLLTEEALEREQIPSLLEALRSQPSWSELPLVVLTNRGELQRSALLELITQSFGSVTLLERPMQSATLLLAVQAARRSRLRQYQVRDLLDEQQRRQQELEEAAQDKSRLAAIVESSDDAIVSKGLDGIITSWNRGAELMFGHTAAEAVGQHITFIIPPERHFEETQVLSRVRKGQRVDHFETERMAKDGRRLSVSLTVSPVKDATGRIVGASKVARDITARKEAERDRDNLLASERSARAEAERAGKLKEEFLATLSHELRTPLNAVLGWTHILMKKATTDDSLTHGLEVIHRNAKLQSKLIADLLDMSRIISGKMRLEMERVEIPVVIDAALDSIRPAAEAKEIRIESSVEPVSDAIYGDPSRLQQVVWNLLSNAVKFTPRGGRVQVGFGRVNSHVEIFVTDTGKGIAAEFLPHVFERFRQGDSSATREHGGLGLGLAIVKQLVELHGGNVKVASGGAGKGSTFTFGLPLGSRQAASVDSSTFQPRAPLLAASTGCDAPNLAGVKVLVVDDTADARDLVKRVLEECGVEVTLAGSTIEALVAIEREPPDVILSDIGMPDQDGYELMRNVRRAGIRTPAAALTAFARSEDRTQALKAGFQTHIAKPLEPAELLATVASLAHKTSGNGAREEA